LETLVLKRAPYLLLLLFLSCACVAPLRAADEELVAVMDLIPEGARREEAVAISNQLRAQLLKTGKFTLVDRSQMTAILEEQALQQSGCTSDECAVQVGKLLGVRKILSGSLTKLSDQLWQVSLLMLDVESGKTLRAETETYDGSIATVIRTGVPDLAARLAGVGASPQRAAITVPQTGSAFRDPITGMEFVFVPGGEYEQGCGSWNGGECDNDEKPTRRVGLRPFWLGKTEVTLGQFKQFVNESGYRTEAEMSGGCYGWTGSKFEPVVGTSYRNLHFTQDDRHPVACVSWNDTQAFAKWLAQKSEQPYRLPTETEWEYACRDGGKPVKYAWGDGRPAGNVADEAAKSQFSNMEIFSGYYDGYVFTAPVGSFAASGLGLFDMTGNVSEWTQDVYNDNAYQSGSTSDPIYLGYGDRRVHRGGAWNDIPFFARCSDRDRGGVSAFRANFLGFRLARSP
jgi:formylglycine-generating enzyme required for sulfatase activity